MSKRLIKILAISLICIMIPAAIVVSVVCVAAAQTYELAITTLGTIENVGSITYKVDDEVLEDKAQIRKDADVTVVAEAEGYNFIGWFTESEELLSSESEYTFKMTGAETLYAKFDVIKYNITYKLDEEVIGNVEDVMWGSNLLVLEERKSDEGLAFAGWKKGTDTKVYTSAKFGKETDVELLANFEEIKYMISYNGAEAVEVAWGDELTAGSNDIANGNLFLNWKKGETACPIEEGKEVAKFGVVKEVINLVPAYEKIVYNVSYDGADSVAVTWGTALSEAPEVTGYTFKGWKVSAASDPIMIAVFGYNAEDPEAVIALTSDYQIDETNLYESAYKSVKFILAEGDWAEVDDVETTTIFYASIYDATKTKITMSEKTINNEVVDNELKYGDFSELKLFDTDALANLQSINEKTTETNYNQYNIKGIRFYFGADESAYYTITADTTVADVIALAFDCGALTTASNGYGTDLVLDIALVYAA